MQAPGVSHISSQTPLKTPQIRPSAHAAPPPPPSRLAQDSPQPAVVPEPVPPEVASHCPVTVLQIWPVAQSAFEVQLVLASHSPVEGLQTSP